MTVNTVNMFAVAVQGDDVLMLRPPAPGEKFSKEAALNLAAYLVCLADPAMGDFEIVLDAVARGG